MPYRLSRAQKKANRAKKRYLPDEDYQGILNQMLLAGKVAIGITYRPGIRQGDVPSLCKEDVATDLIDIE